MEEFLQTELDNIDAIIFDFDETLYYSSTIRDYEDVLNMINEYQPDIIISTNIIGRNLLATIKNQIKKPFNSYFIVTDYDFTPGLKNGMENEYIVVPNEDFITDAINKNFKKEFVLPFGITCKPEIYAEHNKEEIISNLPFKYDEKKKLIVVTGGGNGLGKIEQLTKNLVKNKDFYIVLITGKNKLLFERMNKYATKHNLSNLYVTNYIDDIVGLFYIADLVVGKTGGLTSTECIGLQTPIATLKNLPSPEYNNMKYLLNKKLCVVIPKPKRAMSVIKNTDLKKISENMSKSNNKEGLELFIKHILYTQINI